MDGELGCRDNTIIVDTGVDIASLSPQPCHTYAHAHAHTHAHARSLSFSATPGAVHEGLEMAGAIGAKKGGHVCRRHAMNPSISWLVSIRGRVMMLKKPQALIQPNAKLT